MSAESSPSRVYRLNPNAGRYPVLYMIRVDDQPFIMTDVQLKSEPGNLFNLKAKKPNEVHNWNGDTILETDISLFKLIHAHLRGFEIFPLPQQGIPFGRKTGDNSHLLHLSPEATLKNLLRDATDFGLTNLAAKIEREIANQAKASKETKTQLGDDEAAKEFVMLDWVGESQHFASI